MGNTCFKAIRELSGSAKIMFQKKNPDNIKYLNILLRNLVLREI